MNLIDWDFAVTVGSKVAGPGPEVSADEAAAAVVELREGAARSTPLVSEFTGLRTTAGTAPVLVVDRSGWLQANADGFAKILTPIVDKLTEKKGAPSGLSAAIGSRVTGAEVGLLLGFLGSKVLGQFDPFHDPHGRLLLVAPNIVHVEREISADPSDFRLWVCLHEETHRVQFTANPWLGDHLMAQMNAVADTIEPSALLDGLRRGAEAIRGGNASVVDIVSSPEQKEILDRVTGVMSLLEGHADVVMDGVGPSVIPSVAQIRTKFNQRRQGVGTLDKLLRRLLGLDAKMAQYRDGAVFVRHVVDKVGMEQFNAVWTGPETLPSKDEIGDPDAWVARVL
ncbi:zinc-dependent metalloprotease [Nocardioides sp. S-58]|uniref:Zinc-dependent metalloprotease n=1 Tax=Nocardioides renjunii TaxID=3095075 RepID=A0ABU5KEB7_9ACTN|nr:MULTISPECIES: zinc-dependent metalloprotease [unclassified Nocardioides]MDZ5663301.1 zinc-dependent metalloprotease [Nocardioides sp. S-58]WQQ22825.1 zinc-dependent metalloprotease [Nocardioides sp. S-34]